jgi:hypothetical protein
LNNHLEIRKKKEFKRINEVSLSQVEIRKIRRGGFRWWRVQRA